MLACSQRFLKRRVEGVCRAPPALQCPLVSAPADFVGATGVGAGAAGETGAADGENAGTVNGSSPLGVELDERACLVEVAFAAAACRSTAGLAAVAGGALDGCVAGAAPVWMG